MTYGKYILSSMINNMNTIIIIGRYRRMSIGKYYIIDVLVRGVF
ncbi:hypothetical protein HMPREF1992_01083 [Selenomonas sp. oral taxon 892 str. F0426]|nr:hypothetical protein HMPREF1992_01083 [Selenomonas sp. oral taxon 892 str. F0426]